MESSCYRFDDIQEYMLLNDCDPELGNTNLPCRRQVSVAIKCSCVLLNLWNSSMQISILGFS